MTPDYHQYINSAAWKEKRRQVLERDDYRCRICGTAEGPLEVHHSTYEALGNEPLNHLISVCRHCHAVADQCQKKQRERLELTNQVRLYPDRFLVPGQPSKPIEIAKEKQNALSDFASPVSGGSSLTDAQRAACQPPQRLCQGVEDGQLEEK